MATLTDHGWGSPPLHTLVIANRPPNKWALPGPVHRPCGVAVVQWSPLQTGKPFRGTEGCAWAPS